MREGVNLIDTSTNYMDGDSERLVGSVLRELIKSGELTREEVIVVSKIGYVQGHNLKQAEAREQGGRPYPDMVKYGEGIWHCIHREYLADQLTLSMDRLGLATLDVCLLHNPEYFLSEAAHRDGADLIVTRDAFYRRIEQAFTFFESQVAVGLIRYYGVSSNTVTATAFERFRLRWPGRIASFKRSCGANESRSSGASPLVSEPNTPPPCATFPKVPI